MKPADNFNLRKFITEGKLVKENNKLNKEISYKTEILNLIKQKDLKPGDKVKWMFSFPGWKDTTPVEYTGTFSKWGLIDKNNFTKPLIPKYLDSAVGLVAMIKNDKFPSKLTSVYYIFEGDLYGVEDNEWFKTLEKIK